MTAHEPESPIASSSVASRPDADAVSEGGARPLVILPMLREMLIDAGVPWVCYQASMAYWSHSEVVALLIASVFPTVKTLYGLSRRRDLDPVSLLILAGLLFGLGALLLGGGVKVLLLRESLFTGAFGLACLISLLVRSRPPVMFYFGRFFAAGSDPRQRAAFDQNWQYPGFRRVQRIMTLVWGLVFVGEFALRVVFIYTLSPAMVLAVSPLVLGGASVLTMLWTFRYAARARKAGAARRAAAAALGE